MMAGAQQRRKAFYRFSKKPPQVLYALGLGPLIGRVILLLTTTGRRSNLPRVTPLQYEEIEGQVIVASASGLKADWVRNILANPRVEVRIGRRRFTGRADVNTDPARIADFIEYRIAHHPRMIRAIMHSDGLPTRPTRAQLEHYASRLALVTITPQPDAG
jgi:deazaflavin-dependent oxidoreductase (nitroreductase family)